MNAFLHNARLCGLKAALFWLNLHERPDRITRFAIQMRIQSVNNLIGDCISHRQPQHVAAAVRIKDRLYSILRRLEKKEALGRGKIYFRTKPTP